MASKNLNPPRSIGRVLNFTAGRMNAVCAQELEPYGLSLPQWVILSCLWREGTVTVSSLSEMIGTGLPATSRIVDRMEDRGLVARQRSDVDRRSTVVSVTPLGDEFRHLAHFYERINDILLAGFSDAERNQAFDLLERMLGNAKAALGASTRP